MKLTIAIGIKLRMMENSYPVMSVMKLIKEKRKHVFGSVDWKRLKQS